MSAKRVPPIHTQRNESPPWDGCWTLSLAEGIDAATGGKIIVTEAQVRRAAARPDRPGMSDGGNIDHQLNALRILAPKVKRTFYPTQAELLAHLAAGGGAIMSGYQRNAPRGQRKYDPRFYDRADNGHNVYAQGVGNGVGAHWLDPLIPAGEKPPVYPIVAADTFLWRTAGKRVAILINPAELVAAPQPKPDGHVRVKGSWWEYEITGNKADGYEIGRVSRITAGFSGDVEAPDSLQDYEWGGKRRDFGRVISAESAYLGTWVDLTGAPNVTFTPA